LNNTPAAPAVPAAPATPVAGLGPGLAAVPGVPGAPVKPGEMALYNGPKWPHWRDEYKGGRYAQAFFHYVDKNGPNADWKYDKHETY